MASCGRGHVDGKRSGTPSRGREALPERSFRRGVVAHLRLVHELPTAERHDPGDCRGVPVPRGRGLPLAGAAEGLPALADRPLVVGPFPPRGRLGSRHPRADTGGARRRRPERRAPDGPGRHTERALRSPEGGARLERRQKAERPQAPRPDLLGRVPPRRAGHGGLPACTTSTVSTRCSPAPTRPAGGCGGCGGWSATAATRARTWPATPPGTARPSWSPHARSSARALSRSRSVGVSSRPWAS